MILSYAFYLHEARALLRRISRTGFLMTYNELMLSAFKKKVIELPLRKNEALVCKSIFLDYGYKVTSSKFKDVKKDLQGCLSFKTPQFVANLDKFTKLQSLALPLDFCPLFKDLNDAHDVVMLLSQDLLTEFTFSMLQDHQNSVIAQMIFIVIGKLKSLKKLRITAISAFRKTNIEIINSSLSKESPLEELEVTFVHEQDPKSSLTQIKFPKYLKRLRSLTLNGIWHKEFAEVMFDMAS